MSDQIPEPSSDLDYEIEPREALRDALKIFLPLLALISVLAIGYFLVRRDADLRVLRREELAVVDLLHVGMEHRLQSVVADLMFFSRSEEIERAFEHTEPENPDCLDMLAKQFENFASTHRMYDQIRLLDRTGMERVRVNSSGGHRRLCPVRSFSTSVAGITSRIASG
jgi:hypothetical protein